MPDSKHYVARIVIQKVEKSGATLTRPIHEQKQTRTVSDIANIVVSAETLADISAKAGAHLALIDSDEGIS